MAKTQAPLIFRHPAVHGSFIGPRGSYRLVWRSARTATLNPGTYLAQASNSESAVRCTLDYEKRKSDASLAVTDVIVAGSSRGG